MGGWLDSVIQVIDGLKEIFVGGDFWKWVDEFWEKVQQVVVYFMFKDILKYVKIDGVIVFLLIYVGGIIVLLLILIVYFVVEVIIKIFIIIVLLFIICFLFGFLRQMFNSWFQLIFSLCFIFLFCGLVIKVGMMFFNGILIILIVNVDELNLILIGVQVGVVGVFMVWIIW